ncbi:hypothetical protein H0H93_009235 [Arthromyces matolae]|nr:hypothetical protein H0H93_009235 [Arthromyces matolae]
MRSEPTSPFDILEEYSDVANESDDGIDILHTFLDDEIPFCLSPSPMSSPVPLPPPEMSEVDSVSYLEGYAGEEGILLDTLLDINDNLSDTEPIRLGSPFQSFESTDRFGHLQDELHEFSLSAHHHHHETDELKNLELPAQADVENDWLITEEMRSYMREKKREYEVGTETIVRRVLNPFANATSPLAWNSYSRSTSWTTSVASSSALRLRSDIRRRATTVYTSTAS